MPDILKLMKILSILRGDTLQFMKMNGRKVTHYGEFLTLNILYVLNKEFAQAAALAFNPRNAMHISKNDGFFDNDYNQQRDVIINLNTFVQIGRKNYTAKQLEAIRRAQAGE